MNVRNSQFLAFTQRLIDVQRRYPTAIPENVRGIAVAEAAFEKLGPGPATDINAMDPLDPVHCRKSDDHVREADYDGDLGREWRDGIEDKQT